MSWYSCNPFQPPPPPPPPPLPPPPPPPPPRIVYYQWPLQQNVSIPLYCIQLMHSSIEVFNTSIFHTTEKHFCSFSINIGSIFSDLLTWTNPTIFEKITLLPLLLHLSFFLSSLRFSNLICLTKELSWLGCKLK